MLTIFRWRPPRKIGDPQNLEDPPENLEEPTPKIWRTPQEIWRNPPQKKFGGTPRKKLENPPPPGPDPPQKRLENPPPLSTE